MVKGIVLAGGNGTRLRPSTLVTNKHLLPVYDRPMVYYPIQKLVDAGIKDIIIVTGSESAGDFINLLGNGKDFGASFTYRVQQEAGGIAEALRLCQDHVGNDPMVVILGDNIFEDDIKDDVKAFEKDHSKNKIFLKEIPDPERFGVAQIENGEVVNIIEKPSNPVSNLAVTGLYMYNGSVWHIIDSLEPSDRGELEITDVNMAYVTIGLMNYKILQGFWSDAGTPESLYKAATFIKSLRNKENARF